MSIEQGASMMRNSRLWQQWMLVYHFLIHFREHPWIVHNVSWHAWRVPSLFRPFGTLFFLDPIFAILHVSSSQHSCQCWFFGIRHVVGRSWFFQDLITLDTICRCIWSFLVLRRLDMNFFFPGFFSQRRGIFAVCVRWGNGKGLWPQCTNSYFCWHGVFRPSVWRRFRSNYWKRKIMMASWALFAAKNLYLGTDISFMSLD